MTFLIPRREMPQIDEADTTALIEWLTWNRIGTEQVRLPSTQLHFHQRVSWSRVANMDAETYAKPVLISADHYVLDGNHRAEAHRRKRDDVDCIKVGLPFCDALQALSTFAGTYRYADNQPHAER